MNQKTKIEGGCHCGNIHYRYEIDEPLENLSIRACTCSFCTKQGAIYTSDPGGKLNVRIKENEHIQKYRFSSKFVDFIFCRICGVMPLSITEIDGSTFALINIKTSNINFHSLPVQTVAFSKETVEESVKRRQSKWIPEVEGI
ncbi:MAG: hypothetical protein L3J88_05230 [Gammaproteobacteria bacterium]|nr:hypothetical protein [Gammaproteobacteria bacterium]MCF6362740.1 hypothetical protein [Gammaproteobacteria bacterium]